MHGRVQWCLRPLIPRREFHLMPGDRYRSRTLRGRRLPHIRLALYSFSQGRSRCPSLTHPPNAFRHRSGKPPTLGSRADWRASQKGHILPGYAVFPCARFVLLRTGVVDKQLLNLVNSKANKLLVSQRIGEKSKPVKP